MANLNLSIEQQYSSLFEPSFEPSKYHRVNENFGTFSFLMLRAGQNLWDKDGEIKQFSFKLCELPERLPEFIRKAQLEKKHLYISQASFKGFSRRRAEFLAAGCLFVDLDIYTTRAGLSLSTAQIVNHVYEICETFDIPNPSIIINSGGGLYLKWFIEHVGQYALSYWEVVQNKLNELFKFLGADANAKDISRVLRVVGSENLKYRERPMCEIIDVKWDGTEVSRCQLQNFQALLPHSLEDAQAFNLRMQECNTDYRKIGNKVRREKNQRLLILECLKELDQSGFMETLTPGKLHEYIKTTRQLTRFSMPACEKYLMQWNKQAKHYQLVGESHASNSTDKVVGTVISSARRFNLKRRNWQSLQDIFTLAEHRYGAEGVEDGLRDPFFYIACNQFALSEWNRKTTKEIQAEWNSIAGLLVPDWTQEKINASLHAINARLNKTINDKSWMGSTAKRKRQDGGWGIPLFTFSDQKLHDLLKITPDELQLINPDGSPLIREILGEEERNRRDPDRLKKRHEKKLESDRKRAAAVRKQKGAISRKDYESNSIEAQKPWEKLGISRRTWYNKGKPTA